MAYSARALRLGRRVWASPDVLPWQGWLDRGLDRVRAAGDEVPHRLRPAASWLLWRDAAREACGHALAPDGLGPALRRAARLQDDWGLPASAATVEARALTEARALIETHCRKHGVIDPADWTRVLPLMGPQSNTWLTGFGSLPPARAAALERIGVVPLPQSPQATGAATRGVGCADATAELAAAVHWARARLERDASARLLIVAPQLAPHRHNIVRACTQILDPGSILQPDAAQALYAVEGGEPLADHPLVSAALGLLAVAAGVADFAALSAVLRSPYLRLGGGGPDGARLDAWLREHNVGDVSLRALRRLRQRAVATLGEGSGGVLDMLPAEFPAEPAGPSGWARRMVDLLQRCGWPGPGLNSAELQVRARFDELLGELAALGDVPSCSFTDAVRLLQGLAGQVRFEPASGDVPVTITGAVDDPVVRYDGIWVAQLMAHTWPAPIAPDPFLPLPQQLAAGIPQASASGQLRLARQSMAAWQRCGTECIASWAESEGDVTQEPTGLLADFAAAAADRASDRAVASVVSAPESDGDLAGWMFAHRPRTESFLDIQGPAWTAERLPGGTRALELVSNCAFRSFGELRLRAQPLPAPEPGIDPRVRGILLHAALERFWRATPDWQALRARDEGATLRLVGECVSAAAAAVTREVAEPPGARLLALEQQRAIRVLVRMLQSERERAPFEVEAVESARTLTLGGHSVRLKLDRVDRLEDGARVIIDYKTGAQQRFDAYSDRLPKPQLPAYALAAGEGVSAVAMAFLGREATRWRGLADRSDRLPGVPAPKGDEPPWPQVLERWQRQLTALLTQFAAGEARPDALAESCRWCHLHALCRIDELRLAVMLESSEAEDE